MLLNMLKGKIHNATLTETDLLYEGSIAIDRDISDAAGLIPNERVDIWNITNGARFETYVLEAPRGSKTFSVNGAAARMCQRGDKVIIAAFALMNEDEAKSHKPKIVIMGENNTITGTK